MTQLQFGDWDRSVLDSSRLKRMILKNGKPSGLDWIHISRIDINKYYNYVSFGGKLKVFQKSYDEMYSNYTKQELEEVMKNVDTFLDRISKIAVFI